jgi:hypothetical protein
MNHNSKLGLIVRGTALIVCIALVGCAETNPTKTMAEFNASNIQKVRNSYSMYATVNGGAPKDMDSFVKFLKEDAGAQIRLKRMGIDVDRIDDIFVSERDGEPFVIRWGLGGSKDHAIVFESVGVDGMRMAAYYEPKELDSAECDKLLQSKK